MARFDGVGTASGSLPLYFLVLSIIVVLSFFANKFSLSFLSYRPGPDGLQCITLSPVGRGRIKIMVSEYVASHWSQNRRSFSVYK